MDGDDPSAVRDVAEAVLYTALLLAVPTLHERVREQF